MATETVRAARYPQVGDWDFPWPIEGDWVLGYRILWPRRLTHEQMGQLKDKLRGQLAARKERDGRQAER